MVAVVMADVQTSLPWFDRNWVLTSNCCRNLSFSCGFSISQGPIFDVPLKAKKVKRDSVFGSRARNCGAISWRLVDGGALEKEFEFKPFFDEYLKTMETVRERRQRRNSNGHDSMKDSWGKDAFRTPSEKDEESVKLGDLEGQSHRKMSKALEQNDLYKNSNGDSRQEELGRGGIDCRKSGSRTLKDYGRIKFEDKGNRGNVSGSDELGCIEGEIDVNVKMRLDIDTDGGSIKNNGGYQLGHCFGTNKHGLRSNRISGRLEKDYVRAEKNYHRGIASKIVELGSGDPIIKNNDVQLGMERAAFKSLEVSNDVLFKPRVSRMEMEERIQRLAKCLNGADINMPAWMFTKMMRSARIRYSDHSILRVIQILGKLGNWKRVLQVLDWMQMKERFKSHKIRYIYTAALDVLGKSRRPVEALNVFNTMQQHMSSYPDLVAYHCIAVTLGQAGHLKELFGVIDSMRSPPKRKFKTGLLDKWDPRLEPDIIVYNAVLNACVRRKQWEGAFWVLQQLKQQGQQPSSTTYGLVMEVMFVCGKYNLVHDFFKKGQKSSMPSALTYKVLVNTLWKEGRTDDATLAVQDMERRGIIGSAGLYYDLARCLCSAGRCKEALMQIDKICKVANKPLVVTYTGLIQACLDAGNIQNGEYIFNHMHKFCSPNLVTCNIMLKAYLDHGMFQEAQELFQKMLEDSNHVNSKSDYKNRIIPDIYTFNIMLDACIAEQRWDNLFNIYKQMLCHGYHFNAKRHLRIIVDACRAGKVELLETTLKHLARAGRKPPPLLIKEVFRIKLEHGDYSAALSCISSNQWSESPAFSHKAWLNFFEENGHLFRKDTFARLINESSSMASRSESQNLIIQNLITCCTEFLKTHLDWPNRNFE